MVYEVPFLVDGRIAAVGSHASPASPKNAASTGGVVVRDAWRSRMSVTTRLPIA